jgi:polyisoprenyl-teichoic acid--peptidoglycan teichoic acid transferase
VSPEMPPAVGASMLRRALIAGVAIVLMTASAVSAAVFLEVEELKTIARDFGVKSVDAGVTRADAGEPRTIMLLGSDERLGVESELPAHSDTIILARLDPDKEAITLLSIPRDLKVTIPAKSGPRVAKINEAYTMGKAKLAVKTVERLFSTAEQPFYINHVLNVSFGGFRRAVDYLGCAYVDIDRRYYNDHSDGVTDYATIDVQPGYQKLCGRDALDYVRYRHTDNDLVRAARQQDFLRQLKSQPAVQERLTVDNRKELVKIFSRYAERDKTLEETSQLFSLLKLGMFIRNKPITEVHFDANKLSDDGSYLEAPESELRRVVRDFMAARTSDVERGEVKATDAEKAESKRRKKRRSTSSSEVPGLENAKKEGEDQAILADPKLDFPFYFPTLRTKGGRYESTEPRIYRVRDQRGKLHQAYRMVIKKGIANEYYGVQGMTWEDAPILEGNPEIVTRNGRKLRVYYDGRRVRLVAWTTSKGVYYVHNTLLRSISKRQMLAIAASMRRLGQ